MTKTAWKEAYNERRRVERERLKTEDPEEYRRRFLQPLKKRAACEVPGCESTAYSGYAVKCEKHRDACIIEGCDTKTRNNGKYCGGHAARVYGGSAHIPIDVPIRRQRWNGEWHVNDQGYVHRHVNNTTELQHRVVMEEHLGRKLRPDEEVHHKYGDRTDNRLEALELWIVGNQPRGQRVTDKLDNAVELIERYWDELPPELAARLDKALKA